MPELPPGRLAQYGVFTTRQAYDSGLTRNHLQGLRRSGEIVALRRGVYMARASYAEMHPSEQARARAVAACLARHGSVISHRSAVLIHGLPLLGTPPTRPELTLPAAVGQHGSRDRSTVVRVAQLPDETVIRRGHLAVTSIPRTIIDVARTAPPVLALAALDAALHRRRTTLDAVVDSAAESGGWSGSRQVLPVLRVADGRAESPYESLARWNLLQIRAAPIPQVWAFDRDGPIGRGDLWLEAQWTFLEVDGDVKYGPKASTTSLVDEKRRQERLERAGFGVARMSPNELSDLRLISRRIIAASRRGQLARMASPQDVGYVGPRPWWATAGATVPIRRPAAHQ